MPSKSPKQARFMAACAHGADYGSCPSKKVSREFNQADKGGKMLRRKHLDKWAKGKRTLRGVEDYGT